MTDLRDSKCWGCALYLSQHAKKCRPKRKPYQRSYKTDWSEFELVHLGRADTLQEFDQVTNRWGMGWNTIPKEAIGKKASSKSLTEKPPFFDKDSVRYFRRLVRKDQQGND